jgi:hypothetical protein
VADNLEWIRGRLAPGARVLVFTAVGHLSATVVQMPEHTYRENIFAAVNVPRCLLDLRSAPADVSQWLKRVNDHWTPFFSQRFATTDAFDLVYFVSPITSACRAATDKTL